ncbi:DUF695 domain-containing protein [Zooshikella harenae]
MVDVKSDDGGKRLVIRIRKNKPPIPDIKKYKTCIEIKWDYSLQAAGMPDEKTSSAYKCFEEAIDELCWYNNLSFNVRITTGMGARVWVFYTKSYKEFIKILNRKLEELPTYPLNIWKYNNAALASFFLVVFVLFQF